MRVESNVLFVSFQMDFLSQFMKKVTVTISIPVIIPMKIPVFFGDLRNKFINIGAKIQYMSAVKKPGKYPFKYILHQV